MQHNLLGMTDSERNVVLLIYVNELRVILRVIYVQFVCTYWQIQQLLTDCYIWKFILFMIPPPPPLSNPPLGSPFPPESRYFTLRLSLFRNSYFLPCHLEKLLFGTEQIFCSEGIFLDVMGNWSMLFTVTYTSWFFHGCHGLEISTPTAESTVGAGLCLHYLFVYLWK